MTQSIPAAAGQIRAARGIGPLGGGGARPAGTAAPQAPTPRPQEGGPMPGDAANNAPIIVWLCTEAGESVNGLRVGSSGWQVTFTDARHVTRSITKPGRWTVEELLQLVPASLTQGITNPAPPMDAAAPSQPQAR